MKEISEASLHESLQNLQMGIKHLPTKAYQELLVSVLETTSIPFLVTLPSSGKVLYSNHAFRELFGYTQQELLSLKSKHFFLCEEEQQRLLDALYLKREISCLEIQGKSKQDKTLTLRLTLSLSKYQDEDAVIVAFEDISKRKELEESLTTTELLYRSLIDAMQEGVIMRMADGRISMVNKAAERIYGTPLERVDKSEGVPNFEAVDEGGNLLPVHQYPTFEALQTGVVQKNKVLGVKTPKGSWIWIKMNVVPLFHENEHKPYACVASFSDISNQKATEQKLRDLNTTKDTLFKVVGHDLRSQIAAIMGVSDLIELEIEDIDRPNLHHYLELLKTAAAGSFNLLQNLTDWAHSQFSENTLEAHRFYLYDKVKEVLDLFVPLLKQKNIQVEVAIPEHVQVTADANIVTTILRNLISNALKYSLPRGHVRIDSVFKEGTFSFTVQDSGIGMSQQQINQIWTNQPVNARPGTQQEKGSGIGLRLVKHFVEKHKGAMQLDSASGLGTAFTITLPELNQA